MCNYFLHNEVMRFFRDKIRYTEFKTKEKVEKSKNLDFIKSEQNWLKKKTRQNSVRGACPGSVGELWYIVRI